jgi:predicted TIM-barrel enzyme
MATEDIIQSIFGTRRALIGMVHVGALPGTPSNTQSLSQICRVATEEAGVLRDSGFSGIMLENMHDRPYLKRRVGPEIVASMAIVGQAIRETSGLPTGIQILGGANHEALAVAQACGGSFIRAESFVYSHVADEGIMEADAGDLLRYRRAIGAEDIRVFTDVKKKHSSHSLTADVDLAETARAAEFFSQAVDIPTLVGSGLTASNLARFAAADGYIVGSSIKKDGLWSNPIDVARIGSLIAAYRRLESSQIAANEASSKE